MVHVEALHPQAIFKNVLLSSISSIPDLFLLKQADSYWDLLIGRPFSLKSTEEKLELAADKKMKEILSPPAESTAEDSSDLLRSVRAFYQSCLDYHDKPSSTEDNQRLVQDLISKYGQWPLLDPQSWNEAEFDLQKMLGMNILQHMHAQ